MCAALLIHRLACRVTLVPYLVLSSKAAVGNSRPGSVALIRGHP